MPIILIISFSEIRRDPRVLRQIRTLNNQYQITVAGFGCKPDLNIKYIKFNNIRKTFWQKLVLVIQYLLKSYEQIYWHNSCVRSGVEKIINQKFDLVIANDVETLPLALKLASGRPVLLDAHEYAPRQFEDRLLWRMIVMPYKNYICKTYLPRVSGMITVCEGIAKEYLRVYKVNSRVITNAPYRENLNPSPIQNATIRIIHHGGTNPSRKQEKMIKLMEYLDDRYTLDFMLMPSKPKYLTKLRKLAANNKRIRFVEPVPMPHICQRINEYDIGLYILEPNGFNQMHSLPNKLFEYIQARLAVAIGPSPEMANIVNRYKLGVVAKSFDPRDLANILNSLSSQDIKKFKEASHRAADELCFEVNANILLKEIERLLMKVPSPCAS
ncbi:MAG: hypothetical protein HPY51_00710 [Candidatus Omnitrophica bacterium]|nr:hypothetical protein [Candidatus Omnitrophota bacterium]